MSPESRKNMTECEDCEERDARIADLEHELSDSNDDLRSYIMISADYAKKNDAERAKVKKLRDALENIEVLHTPGKPWSPIECFGKIQSIARQALKETRDAEWNLK